MPPPVPSQRNGWAMACATRRAARCNDAKPKQKARAWDPGFEVNEMHDIVKPRDHTRRAFAGAYSSVLTFGRAPIFSCSALLTFCARSRPMPDDQISAALISSRVTSGPLSISF
jgi:hypothetical protein